VPVNQEQYPDIEGSAENYRAFLLRCWQEADAGPAGGAAWRFTLVHLGQGQTRKGFACLEELVAYLDEQLAQAGRNPQPAQESNISE